jgi:hypothetical protein
MTLRTLLTGMTLLVFLSTAVVTAQAATTDADQIGQVHFPTSCRAEAQVHFDRAVALLHSFWFPEAINADFRGAKSAHILHRKPQCF